MLWIDNNNLLGNLSGLNNVKSVAGLVEIFSNSSMTTLAGLENLVSIGGSLFIGGQGHLGGVGNPSLTSLGGLTNLGTIGGTLEIGYNSVLTNLSGLDNLEAGSISSLAIYNNEALFSCTVQSVCDYLGGPLSQVDIHDNAQGCNSPEEVRTACILLSGDGNSCTSLPKFFPNPVINNITIATDGCIHGCRLSVSSLSGEERIRRYFTTSTLVTDLSGLPAGVYFISLTDDKGNWMRKFIRQ